MTAGPGLDFSEELLGHRDRIRAVALALARDPNQADDLAQEAWVNALSHPPGHRLALSGWVAQVVRTTFLQERRSLRRRSEREARAAGVPDARTDIAAQAPLEREELLEAVRECVRDLPDPYRLAIVLRHFENLPPRLIAERLDVPVKTVKTWLERGHERLREKLDRRLGKDRATWMLALLHAVQPPAGTAAPVAGTMGVVAVRLLAGVAVALAAVAGWWILQPAAPQAASPGGTVRVAAAAAPETPPPTAASERSAIGSDGAAVAPSGAVFRGRVVDAAGLPVAGAEVRYRTVVLATRLGLPSEGIDAARLAEDEPGDLRATADAAGRFELLVPDPPDPVPLRPSYGGSPLLAFDVEREAAEPRGLLYARSSGRVPLFGAVVTRRDEGSALHLVVCAKAEVTGIVVDAADRPLAGAAVTWMSAAQLREAVGVPLLHGVPVGVHTVTDAAGAFALSGQPLAPGGKLVVVHGRETVSVAAPHAPRSHLRIVVDPALRPPPEVQGRLLNARGRPIHFGAVTDGIQVAAADADGRYRMESVRGARLIAICRGYLPVEMPWPLPAAASAEALDFTLERAPRALSGRVVDATGAPVAGVRVGVERLTGLWDGPSETPVCVEHVLERRGPDPWVGAVTDAEGRFEIVGLCDRPYDLIASRTDDPRVVRAAQVLAQAGEITLRWPEAPRFHLRARVVDVHGSPLPGAEVAAVREVAFLPRPEGPDARIRARIWRGTAGADGGFELPCDDVSGLVITATLAGRLPVEWRPDPEHLEQPGTLVLANECYLRVDASACVDPPHGFSLLDGEGRVVAVEIRRGAWYMTADEVELRAARSETVAAPEGVRAIRYLRDGSHEDRPLLLRPGELTTLVP